MDFLTLAGNIVIPRWVKYSIAIILTALFAGNISMAVLGILHTDSFPGWMEAGAYLLGILLPIILLGLIFLFAETGIPALKKRTYTYLTQTIPSTITTLDPLAETYYKMVPPLHSFKNAPKYSAILTRPHKAGHSVFYNIVSIVPPSDTNNLAQYYRIKLIVELNVKKANVVFFIPSGPQTLTIETLKERFKQSFIGAEKEGYTLNPELSETIVDGQTCIGVVLIRQLDENFMSNSNSKLYFAQDMMLMIRSLLNECPDLFELVTPKETKTLGLQELTEIK